MKYFICALACADSGAGNCLLGIPSEHTKQIIPVNRVQTSVYETDNEEAFVSIPALLKLKDQSTHHGIVLKTKTTLLLPRIDVELDIPEEKICKLPIALEEIFNYFKGVYFNTNMILLLEPEKLMEHLK